MVNKDTIGTSAIDFNLSLISKEHYARIVHEHLLLPLPHFVNLQQDMDPRLTS